MLVLALDSTTRAGSVTLALDGREIETFIGDPLRPHAERVPSDATGLLARHGYGLGDVGLFAVAAGPGSFTGLRIGIAAIQGLAFAGHRPVIGVSALEALAHAAWRRGETGPGRRVGVWMDAQRGEVFSALFDASASAPDVRTLPELDAACVELPADGAARWAEAYGASPFALVGDGATRYADLLRERLGSGVRILDVPPLAPSIAALAAARLAAGESGLPHALRPVYVRRPDAELARDRRQQAGS
jgi:tRNA threonylcarbamoyladenosine biosynthesis protein TsaB